MGEHAERVIRTLPEVQYGDEWSRSEENVECSICLEQYEKDERIRFLPCGHHFHANCADEWLKEKQCCPLCKQGLEDAENLHNKDGGGEVNQLGVIPEEDREAMPEVLVHKSAEEELALSPMGSKINSPRSPRHHLPGLFVQDRLENYPAMAVDIESSPEIAQVRQE